MLQEKQFRTFLIHSPSQLLTRLPLGIALVALFAASPFLLMLVLRFWREFSTGVPCVHAGQCGIVGVGYLMIVTVPLGALLLCVLLLLVALDGIQLWRKHRAQAREQTRELMKGGLDQ